MAAHTDNEVTIAAPLELVWRIANDVQNWPNLFVEEYAKAEILERHEDRLVFRLTTTPDEQGRSFSWVSERFLDHAGRTTTSRRLSAGPLVYMHIFQHFEPVDGGVRLRWVQDFEVRPAAPFTDAQLAERINGNSRIQLAEHKRFMEQTHQEEMAQ
jgi:aromatase